MFVQWLQLCSHSCTSTVLMSLAHTVKIHMKRQLTSSVFELVDGIGHDAYTSQEASALLLVDLLVVPHTDSDGVFVTNIPRKKHLLLIHEHCLIFTTHFMFTESKSGGGWVGCGGGGGGGSMQGGWGILKSLVNIQAELLRCVCVCVWERESGVCVCAHACMTMYTYFCKL